MKPLLIALHGLPGSGKDTFANRLIEGGGWGKVSFAAPLKRGISTMLNIPMEDIENPSIKNEPNYKFGRSIRYIAQTLGTEWGRNIISDDLWVQLGKESIVHMGERGINVVNTDLRFANEAEMIRELGGYVIHVIRDDKTLAERSESTGMSNHASNISLRDELIDFTIFNSRGIEEFQNEASSLISLIALNQS